LCRTLHGDGESIYPRGCPARLTNDRCFYVLIIWAGANVVLIFLFVPETYHPVLLRNKAIRLRKETGNPEWIAPIEKLDRSVTMTVLWSCLRPFQLLLLEPMVGKAPLGDEVSLAN
jgi:hypothetical protein